MSSSSSSSKRFIRDLETPAFLVDKSVMERNCRRMSELSNSMGLTLRGHTKTHKTVEGAVIQTGGTKRTLVVSTLTEAEMYAENGFDDILYGYPLIERHMVRNYRLTEVLSEYHVMICGKEAAEIVTEKMSPPRNKKWSVFLSVDTGNGREGFRWDGDEIIEIAEKLWSSSDFVVVKGIYAHCGQSYSQPNVSSIQNVLEDTIAKMCALEKRLRSRGMEMGSVGIGSTPSLSHPVDSLKLVTEIHPGNYVFYDAQNVKLGSCKIDDIACRVATRIIGHYPERNQLLVDCGFLGMTQQGYEALDNSYAIIQDHPNLRFVKSCQEIGTIVDDNGLNYEEFPVGSMLFLYPFHSCATAACYSVYYVHDENERIIEEWICCKGWI